MELTPATYVCTVDGHDLTALVLDELAVDVPVAFRREKVRPFRVVVSCPGSGRAHEVTLAGQVRYST